MTALVLLLLGLPAMLATRLTGAPREFRMFVRVQIAVMAGIALYLLREVAMAIAKPIRPGTVIQFQGQQTVRIPPSAAATVAIPIVADWGPVGADSPGAFGNMGGPQLLASFQEFTDLYGDSDTAGRTAVAGAFAGQGLAGAPGAGGVLVWRMATNAAAVATATIVATGAGAPTLRLDAIYKGARGNRISFIVDIDPNNASNDRLRLYFDGALRETYTYTAPGLAAFAAAVNARSQLVRATALVADTAPALRLTQNPGGTAIPLANGNDGSVVTSVEHLAALAGIQYKAFGIIAPYDLTDSTIQAAYKSWVQAQAQASRPCRLVIGGAAAETMATAITRSQAMADEHIINVGCGTFHDDLLGKDLSTSQLAPRIAGVLAAKGERHAITFAELGGIHAVTGAPSDVDALAAVQNGVVCLTPTTSPDADLHIEKGVTTYTADTPTKPQSVYGSPRLIGIMDDYVREMKAWGDSIVIGELPVNDDTRNMVRGRARQKQDDLLTQGLILPGDPTAVPPIPAPWVSVQDTNDPSLQDAIPYSFGWQFAKTANAILGQGTVL